MGEHPPWAEFWGAASKVQGVWKAQPSKVQQKAGGAAPGTRMVCGAAAPKGNPSLKKRELQKVATFIVYSYIN